MPIKLLDKNVCELIAAGEVVERPASVIKELVENSLDAGARHIEIELKNNGLALMRVTDDGCGIAADDIKKAFLRHATSKISNADDLDGVVTLGFRGEALAAIASVSKTRVVSRSKTESYAVSYSLEAGEQGSEPESAGAPFGTSMYVADIFYNTPARMKFLKKDVHEGNAVQSIVEQLALTHPETAFRLLRDGRLAFSSPGDGSLYSAAFSVLPRETAESLVAIEPHDAKVSVSGYISRPRGARASRSLQYICVNGRFVKTRGIAAAAEEACRSLVMSGKHPAFIINVSLPCGDVDVNVHPAKTEVRFRNEREVTSAVYAAVRLALEAAASEFEPLSQNSAPAEFGSMSEEQLKSMQRGRILSESGELAGECEPQFAKSEIEKAKLFESDSVYELFLTENNKEKETYAVAQKATDYVTRASGVRDYLLDIERDSNVRCTERADDTRCENKREVETTHAQTRLEKAFDSATEDDEQPLMLRVIGEVLEVYIIAQCGRELVLIDKHAAHERLLFEKLREVIDGAGVDRQLLAEPVVVAVTVEEKQLLLDSRSELDCVGFVVDEFGEREVAVREIPTYLSIGCAADAVLELAAGLAGAGPLTTSAREWLLHSCACRAAIKAGHRSSNEELTALVRDVLAQKIPMHCPHGRPIFITFAEKELERRFGRVQ